MHMYMHVHIQTHPHIHHNDEIHMLNYVTLAQTLPNTSNDPTSTLHLTCPQILCPKPLSLSLIILLSTYQHFASQICLLSSEFLQMENLMFWKGKFEIPWT